MLSEGLQLSGRFRLRQRLGAHEGSVVWLADDALAGRPVALKFLRHPEDPAQRRALLRHELACMARVTQASVARAVDVFEHEGEPFLAVEAVLGHADRVSGAGTRPRELASLRGALGEDWIRPVLQLTAALQAVHEAGVVHRDVKSSNVLIDRQGNALLIDFGVAAIVRDAPAAHALRSGGSPLSMSPQQRAGEAPAVSDDIYAFGVLMHELAFGRAPIEGAVAAAEGIPTALSQLIGRCLASEAGDRPKDMSEVGRALARVAAADFNATRAPLALSAVKATEFIRPAPLRAGGGPGFGAATAASPGGAKPARRQVPWRFLGAVSAVWLLVLSAVLLSFLAPRTPVPVIAQQAPPTAAPRQGGAGGAARESRIAAPMEFARLRRERAAMLDDVNAVLDLQSALQARAVADWGEERYAEAVDLAKRGDELFRANDFEASAQAYAQAQSLLQALEQEAPEAAKAALAAGLAAYEAGKATEAVTAFEQALAIDASLDEARQGLERAQQLDEVLSLTAKADALARSGALREAASTYQQVLALDAARQDARDALASLRSRLDRSSFDQRMSEGFTALTAGDFAAARRAFEAAGKIDPNATAVRDALAQVEVDARSQRLASLGEDAERLVAAERWREALAAYDEALAIDGSLRFAREGRELAARMQELNEQLTFYADDPQRLMDPAIRQRASQVLERARQATPRGPQLEARQARLADAIEQVRQPVLLRLASDNRTSVRILRAADLGRFEQTEIELRPGRYTIVGTREGYRDVREELVLGVGGRSEVVDIRCVEEI